MISVSQFVLLLFFKACCSKRSYFGEHSVHMSVVSLPMFVSNIVYALETNDVTHGLETLPKALQAQALTAFTSNFGLVGGSLTSTLFQHQHGLDI